MIYLKYYLLDFVGWGSWGGKEWKLLVKISESYVTMLEWRIGSFY
jgi:hypothetical protein